MEQNQNALFERFHQAITSMEAQLISLYEEKVQNGNSSVPHDISELSAMHDIIGQLNQNLFEVKSDRDNLSSENELLRSRCTELENCLNQEINNGQYQSSEQELQELHELREANSDLHHQIEELHNSHSQAPSQSISDESGVGQQTLKIMRKNIELATLNEDLGNKLSAMAMHLDEARSEVQRLKALGEQELIVVKRELQDELQKVKGELIFHKSKFRELGASIMERFFAE